MGSLPARGAWIEIDVYGIAYIMLRGRSPQGERGLKFTALRLEIAVTGSLPARGAWIEMETGWLDIVTGESLPARGAWIEITW